MDPRKNPYTPGAGTPPAELAGRDDVIERAKIALDRIRNGKAARGMVFYGLRGVGKTVLLNRLRLAAEEMDFATINIEAPEGRSLPGVLAPALKMALIRLSRVPAFKSGLQRAQDAFASFVKRMKIKYQDVEITFDDEDENIGPGDLEVDLIELFETLGVLARERKTGFLLAIDELQYVPEDQLAALISAFHQMSQKSLPVMLLAAGLPQLVGLAGRAKSYAERLFEFVEIDRLDTAAATIALCNPAQQEGAEYAQAAVEEVLEQTHGYPYFLQEWGKHCWNTAPGSPISKRDAKAATELALAELDASFFRVRFDRLTPMEKNYLRAMAEIGPGPHRSGEVARMMDKKVSDVAALRNSLITKGMIYAPSHGDTGFTVPLFDEFMKRVMPRWVV